MIFDRYRFTPHGRALLVYQVLVEALWLEEVAQPQGISVRTVYKCLRRFREEESACHQGRSSRP
ncbi:leucine zipper domain-containing protein [Halomonas sp.]|uniref:leucine zipper domain-containing protein n=1 Tax=Halomonas sp. TaxID=1486246 RepID=UPI0038603382